jgi:hypothetical protein
MPAKYTVKLERWVAEQPENDTYRVVSITGGVEIPIPYKLGMARAGDELSAKQAKYLSSVATLTIKRANG